MEISEKNLRKCSVCNVDYYRRGTRSFKTCSRQCQKLWLSEVGIREQYWKLRKSKPPGRKPEGIYKPCRTCGKDFYIHQKGADRAKYCSIVCRSSDPGWPKRGAENYAWKGGKYIMDGYVYIKNEDHPNRMSRNYIAEHRLVMSTVLGRPLTDNEQVHHINGIKTDNRPVNLEVVIKKMHYGNVDCPRCKYGFKVK